ncbi:MAG: R3H domain-containing nucleic acid-binding protein [Candidatus Bipolaricaulota bacterium]
MDEVKQEADAFLKTLLGILDEDAAFEIEAEGEDGLYVNLIGGPFALPEERPILSALEHLLRGALHRKTGIEVDVVLDANGAIKRRRAELVRFALDKAEDAIREHRKIRLNPMPSHERRTIHMALSKYPGVRTYSMGTGDHRRVVLEPDES